MTGAAVDVVFPELSQEEPDMEGVLATWFVADGETVKAGQLIAEVQVEKVSADVEAPAAGVVGLVVAEQAAVRQGELIARITPAAP